MSTGQSSGVDSKRWRQIIDERHGYAAWLFLIGLSLVVLSVEYVGEPEFVPVAAGGWFLLGLSESLLAGRMTFEPWIPFPNERIEWISIGIGVLLAAALVAISLWVVLNG